MFDVIELVLKAPATEEPAPVEQEPADVVSMLTRQQRRILSEIRDFHTAHGYAPSVRDLGQLVGLSVSSVHHQLGQLQSKGWISRAPGRSRAIVVLDPATGQP
ncbi:LexA family protein [Paractinoplanes maris]|uniref:LexA family protein n=1 Tax=Paractinoplanes maris TaxID=1734446 RepID=UPI0020202775|nr:MarR family transcriptional regulator [Actinoplanes maris]